VLRVLLIDGDARVRQGLRVQLQLEPGVVVVGEAETDAQAFALAQNLLPDVVIMDVDKPGKFGLDTIRALHHINPCCPLVILSMYDDLASRNNALAAGADTYVGKGSVELFRDALHDLLVPRRH
jgi:DNA-binding NarL/FixJ family response regulator